MDVACGVSGPVHEDLCRVSFNLFSMGRRGLCHDRRMGLLLTEYVQDSDAVQVGCENAGVQALYLSAGYDDLYEDHYL